MLEFSTLILSTYVAQAIGTALLAFVIFSLWRKYKRQHLCYWAISFCCLFLFLGGKTLGLWSYGWTYPSARTVLMGATLLFGIAQPLFLLMGAVKLALGRDVTRRGLRGILLGLFVTAVAGAALSLLVAPEWRLPLRVGLCTVVSVASLSAGAIVIRRSSRSPIDVGKLVVVGGFLLYAASQLTYLAASIPIWDSALSPWGWYAGFGDVVFQGVIGLGLIVWHLEEEHADTQAAWEITRRTEDALARARRLEVVGRVAGGIAHDYNNMLMSMLGHSEMARATLGNDEIHEHLDAIDGLIDKASSLSRQLLSAGRNQVTSVERLSLCDALAQREYMLRHLLEPQISLQVEVDADVPDVEADPAQVEQIMLNLTLNARDALEEGGVLRITLKQTELDAARATELGLTPGIFVLWCFEDDGPGISPDAMEHLFEAFYTTKPAGEGSGLGLSSIRDYVCKAGGTIECESEPGRGTKFEIRLPGVGSSAATMAPTSHHAERAR